MLYSYHCPELMEANQRSAMRSFMKAELTGAAREPGKPRRTLRILPFRTARRPAFPVLPEPPFRNHPA
jgi:hypothetical protein